MRLQVNHEVVSSGGFLFFLNSGIVTFLLRRDSSHSYARSIFMGGIKAAGENEVTAWILDSELMFF